MSISFLMKGALEEVEADEDFHEAITAMNTTMARGVPFVVLDGMAADHIALNISNIIRVKELG